VTILGGVHGNELVGIEVVKWLREQLSAHPEWTTGMTGELIFGLGNPAAIEIGRRATSPDTDLNRCFQVHPDRNPSTVEAQRAEEIRPILERTDILIDIHATNKPSPPFLRVAGPAWTKHHRRIVDCFRHARTLLRDKHFCLGLGTVCTTDEFVGQLDGGDGRIGICYETGHADDMSVLPVVQREIGQFLRTELNIDFPVEDDTGVHPALTTYNMIEAIPLLSEHDFEWAPCNVSDAMHPFVGDANFQHVPAHSEIGYMTSRVDGLRKIVKADYDSWVVFPKVLELMAPTKPVVWLTRREGE
jgi:hypothetical protein